jgi:hypothetical protein
LNNAFSIFIIKKKKEKKIYTCINSECYVAAVSKSEACCALRIGIIISDVDALGARVINQSNTHST